MTSIEEKRLETITRTRNLLKEMVSALMQNGYPPDDDLMVRAKDLDARLGAEAMELSPQRKADTAVDPVPLKLHQLPAETVDRMDLSDFDALGLPPHTREDLAEAAFTFENQLMALLGDDNAMPWESYADLSFDRLVKIVESAVNKICRLGSG